MKKLIALLLVLTMVLALAACTAAGSTGTTGSNETTAPTGSNESTGTTDPVDDPAVKSEGVMTHAEYAAAAVDDAVVIEAYVQAKQSWWEKDGQGLATVYLQDTEGGYLAYNLHCTEAEYNQMTVGTKLKISGYKTEWSGEYEIAEGDATFEILEGSYIAEPLDATALLAAENLIDYQNMKVAFKGMTVEASKDGDGNDVAFLYKWNGTGAAGDDLYFNVSVNGNTYTFCVESYLCADGTEVYDAVEALKVGDVIDLEGFLYWYNGAQPHITSVTASK